MALSDTRTFLIDLLQTFDPDIDLSDGSRAQTNLIEPILTRIGPDPFDEDIHVFIRDRIRQSFPDLAITEADDLTDVLIDPLRVLFEPITREIKLIKLRASLANIESLSDEEVDALMGNFFESRRAGGFAIGVVRAMFATPQTISITFTQPATTRSGLRFFPTRPQQITADQMLLNVLGSEYYFDINYTAENRGDQYNVEAGEIVSIGNLPTATSVKNLRRFRLGAAREASTDFAARTQRSVSDKTLTVERGITATLFENFPALKQLFVVGFHDPEMMRDIIKGGGLGPVPDPDAFGKFYGTATAIDDLDGNNTSPVFDAGLSGHFVSRLGSAGSAPTNWYVTLVYNYDLPGPPPSELIVVDAQVLEVVSDSRLRVDHEIPLTGVSGFVWMLRERKLTISDIPGGIVLPDTASGALDIRTDEVHIGGKTDVYVAGESEQATSQIDTLSDEDPISRGFNAQTVATDTVKLNDIANIADVEAGMSLVLEEGSDAGSYLIISVPEPRLVLKQVQLSNIMTGTQSNLSFRIIDEIDVELTDPRDTKVAGGDLVTSAGSDIVTTLGATNFLDVNVAEGDILEVIDALGGGEFTVVEPSATTVKVTPVLPRTIVGARYSIFKRFQAVQTPILRVSALELLDSTGAPTGTVIPYRDPILALSDAFQNEGSGFPFDNITVSGLVTTGVPVSFLGLGGQTLSIDIYDPDEVWGGVLTSLSIIFAGGPNLTPAQVVAQINGAIGFISAGVRATEIVYSGLRYVGLVCPRLIKTVASSALATLGMSVDQTNAQVYSLDPFDTLSISQIDRTYLIEFLSGNNGGTVGRVITEPGGALDSVTIGTGPLGPEGTAALYNNLPLRPDVGGRARIGRPSVGSARVFFLGPTSAEFDYRTTRFSTIVGTSTLIYQPDPENTRVLLPAYPKTDLPNTGTSASGPNTLTDPNQNFLLQRIEEGDVVEILYRPITGSAPLAPIGNILVGGKTLVLRLASDPFITVAFPTDMVRQDVVDYINTRVGVDVASLSGTGELVIKGSVRIEIDSVASTALAVLFLTGPFNTDHPDRGQYIVSSVTTTALALAGNVLTQPSIPDTHYRIFRYVQRISSTEMNANHDSSGLYFAVVEMVSMAPGDVYNIGTGIQLGTSGHRADGYRLSTSDSNNSFSRAERLFAHISPSILLVGSSDSPEEYVQLAQQSVQVAYDRSQITDDVQSFCDSDIQRVVCEEILVRHLSPHYVSLVWSYSGGNSEPEMRRALNAALDAAEPGTQLEVGDLVQELRTRGATSVYTPDTSVPSGRVSPLFLVVLHNNERGIVGLIVKDFVDTVRTQRFIPDVITLTRLSPGGIR